MVHTTLNIARKYGSKAATAAGALVASGMAAAQETGGVAEAVLVEVGKYKVDGTTIAIALVVATLTIGLIYKLARK